MVESLQVACMRVRPAALIFRGLNPNIAAFCLRTGIWKNEIWKQNRIENWRHLAAVPGLSRTLPRHLQKPLRSP